MPRPRYQIADEDVAIVHRWIRTRFRENTWPEDWPQLTAWDKLPLDKPTAKKLRTWCARFLDAAQWKQLHAVIRAARRDCGQSRTVRLSTQAYETLHQLAQREHLTLSTTIERYLANAPTAPTAPAIPTPTPAPKPRTTRTKAKVSEAEASVFTPAPWPTRPPPSKVMHVNLWLRVENNNKFVRGRKKAREEIEASVLRRYQMQKRSPDRGEYLLTIPYETDEELDDIIYDILHEADQTADYRHCFIEADVQSVEDPDRSW
jgi:transposase